MVHLAQSQDHPWKSEDTEMTMETLKRSQRHKALDKNKGVHQQRLSAVAPSLQVPSRGAWGLDISASTCKGCRKASDV